MGAYLSQPITDKETISGEGRNVQYGVSSMQGWRRTMEDAHVALTEHSGDTEVGIFGVFDGHGGGEVAKFCANHLAAELRQLQQYQQGHIGQSLITVFHRMDEMLRDDSFSVEIEGYRGSSRGLDDPASTQQQQQQQPSSPQPGSAAPGSNTTAEQQHTLDVMKRILEIKRMVTEGASGGGGGGSGSTSPPQQQQASSQQQQQQQSGPASLRRTSQGAAVAPFTGKALSGGAESRGQTDADDVDSKFRTSPDEGSNEQCGQVGCTAVVAVLHGQDLYVANAGDSRAVLGRGNTAVALSEDHKPASAAEKHRITSAGGFVSEVGGVTRVNGNLNLSRAIGDLRYKCNSELSPEAQIITAQPDVRRVALTPEDRFLLLACDGIWDVMSNQQAVEFVNERLSRGMKAGPICAELLDACLAKNPKEARGIGCDNMTAEVIIFAPPDAPAAASEEATQQAPSSAA